MKRQLARQNDENVFKFKKHKTAKFYGPLLKWLPNSVVHSLRLSCGLPLRRNKYFWTRHTPMKKVCAAHILQCASVTLEHEGACPNTNFSRKLFGTLICAGHSASGTEYEQAIDDLAEIDAHSATMARTVHYNVSDRIEGGIIKKSVKSFYAVMGAMPRGFPIDPMTQEDFTALLGNLGKRGLKRRQDVVEGEDAAPLHQRNPEDLNGSECWRRRATR